MKYVLLAIFVLFATQPSQASVCDMCDGQDKSGAGHHAMSDHSAPDHSMHGSPMQSTGHGMDCCDDQPVDNDHSCGSMSHCGACGAGLTAVSPSMLISFIKPGSRQLFPTGNEPLSRSSSPPFRPPIC